MKPRLLVTNDDGITAPGLRALIEVASEFGDVIVIAPDSPQSAKGHALTIMDPLRLTPVNIFEGIEAYECTGTPVDCVKLAKAVILKDKPADLCVSGINHGSNASINILYSGTVSAAMEASLEGINSIGFSLLDYSNQANFEHGKPFIRKIIQYVLEHGMDNCKLLNVNIPKLSTSEIKGIKICKQAQGNWSENYMETTDPRGETYYWLVGEFVVEKHEENSDMTALNNGYVSVVPSGHDLTKYDALSELMDLEK